jgi:hypothetical protein
MRNLLVAAALLSCKVIRAQVPAPIWSQTPSGANGANTELGTAHFSSYPARNYPPKRPLHVAADGTVTVSGTAENSGGNDFLTIQYDAQGNEKWRATADGVNGDDRPVSIALDNAGNVFVFGTQDATFPQSSNNGVLLVKYDPNGVELWRRFSALGNNARALAVDSAGNAIVAAARPAGGLVALRYLADGTLAWSASVDGGDLRQPASLAVDSGGNVYVLANGNPSSAALSNGPNFLVKYAPNGSGAESWRRALSPAGSGLGYVAEAVKIDANGNALVLANVGDVDFQDVEVIKFDGGGNVLWRKRLLENASGAGSSAALALDADGAAIVAGNFMAPDSTTVTFAGKVNASGARLWLQQTDLVPGAAFNELAVEIATDDSRNVFLAAHRMAGTTTSRILKFSSSSINQWATDFGIAGDQSAFVWRLATAGNRVVAAGNRTTAASTTHMAVTVYSQSGPVPPGAPAIVQAAGNTEGSVDLHFLPPIMTGGNQLLQYIAACGVGTETAGANSPIKVTGLIAGRQTECTVKAVNGAGAGPASAPVAVTWVALPGAPMDVAAIAGDGAIYLSFNPPSYGGASPIVSYVASCNNGAATATGNGSAIILTPVANDVSYQCQVAAVNSHGTGPASPAAAVIPGAAVPTVAVEARSFGRHGGAMFGLPVNLAYPGSGSRTVESRATSARHEMELRFNRTVNVEGSASASDANGAIAVEILGVNGDTMAIALTGELSGRVVSISLLGVNGTADVTPSIGFLTGDVSGSERVTAADVAAVKARIGQPVGRATARFDLDRSGIIDQADVSMAKSRAGQRIP